MAVSFTVEIGFDSAASTRLALVSWTDVTADVRAWSVNRGRQSELSTYSAGSASVTLNNRSRTYDPSNTAGTYYGKILPRRRLRITLTAGAVSAAIFTGYVADWSMEWPEQGIDSTVTVSASDAFEVMSTRPQPGSAYAAEVLADSPINYWPLQEVDGAGLLPSASGGADLNPTRTSRGVPDIVESSFPVGQSSAVSDGGGSVDWSDDLPLAMEAWVRSPGSNLEDQVVMTVFGADTTTWLNVTAKAENVSVNYSDSTLSRRIPSTADVYWPDKSGESFHLAVTLDPAVAAYVYVNGQLAHTIPTEAGTRSVSDTGYAVVGIGGLVADPAEASIGHVAFYSSTPSATRILAHYEAGLYAYGHPYGEQTGTRIGRILTASGWPTADREITDSGATVVGQWLPAEASALAGCRECETAEQGAFFINAAGQATFRSRNQLLSLARCITSQATFGDDAAETPVTNPLQVDGTNLDFVRNSVTVTYEGGAVTVSDETSVGDYGTLDDSVSAGLLDRANGWVARQLAAYRVRLRKTPVSRVPTIKAQLLDDLETHLAEVIPLELCDRVTVNRRPSGGTGTFSQQCHIQGIRWAWSPARSYAWQAYLSPAVPSYSTADYLLIGDATYGKVGSTHTAVY